jgi:hypothetical protein
MNNAQERIERIQSLYNIIKIINDKGEGADKERIKSQFSIEFGLSFRLLDEYLKILTNSGRIISKEGQLWTNGY